MRYLSIILMTIVLSACQNASNKSQIEEKSETTLNGKLKFIRKDTTTTTPASKVLTCTFEAYNTGTDSLEILEKIASCDCSSIELNKQTIAPNEPLFVTVKINTEGKAIGKHRTTVLLKTNGMRSFYDLAIHYSLVAKN
ncbi:MAG: DUF1573 domain-containing protein [Bacteroidales bacterium]